MFTSPPFEKVSLHHGLVVLISSVIRPAELGHADVFTYADITWIFIQSEKFVFVEYIQIRKKTFSLHIWSSNYGNCNWPIMEYETLIGQEKERDDDVFNAKMGPNGTRTSNNITGMT